MCSNALYARNFISSSWKYATFISLVCFKDSNWSTTQVGPLHTAFIYPAGGGSMFLRNVCNHLQDYMVSHPRRSQSEHSLCSHTRSFRMYSSLFPCAIMPVLSKHWPSLGAVLKKAASSELLHIAQCCVSNLLPASKYGAVKTKCNTREGWSSHLQRLQYHCVMRWIHATSSLRSRYYQQRSVLKHTQSVWDFRFWRRRVWRWLSSGVLRRVVW
jgi:hypothetical protein